MNSMSFTVNAAQDRRKSSQRTNGTRPIQLNINIQRKQYKVSTPIDCLDATWEELKKGLKSKIVGELRSQVNAEVYKAEQILEKMDSFSIVTFKEIYKGVQKYGSKESTTLLYKLYERKITDFKENKQVGSARNYEASYAALETFAREEKKLRTALRLEHITIPFIKAFEKWCKSDKVDGDWAVRKINGKVYKRKLTGCTISTVKTYLRPLRAVYLAAIENKDIDGKQFPFGKKGYRIGKNESAKKGLTKQQIMQLFESPKYKNHVSRDMFMACYIINGCNPKDLLALRKKDLFKEVDANGDIQTYGTFRRSKTEDRHGAKITFHVVPELQAIIDKYNDPASPFLFDILKTVCEPPRKMFNGEEMPDQKPLSELNAEEQFDAIEKWRRLHNRCLGRIAKNLGFRYLNLSMARPSYASVMNDSGAGISYIMQTMGHGTPSTTIGYINDLTANRVNQMSKNLL